MVNRRFQINDEVMLKYCMLSAPPEARIKLQMTNSEVRKTKKTKMLIKEFMYTAQ